MFHFPTFPPHALCVQTRVTGHDSRRVPPFGHPRITARLTAPRGLSQPPTSFIGSWCQGIHRAPLLTWPQRCSRPLCSSQTTNNPPPAHPTTEADQHRDRPHQGSTRHLRTQQRTEPTPQATPLSPHRHPHPTHGPHPHLPAQTARTSTDTQQKPSGDTPQEPTFVNVPPRASPTGTSVRHEPGTPTPRNQRPLRKEVIQPHLPVRLPCYDFVPIADPTFDSSPPRTGWATGFGCYRLS
jgi:hypothetical protein